MDNIDLPCAIQYGNDVCEDSTKISGDNNTAHESTLEALLEDMGESPKARLARILQMPDEMPQKSELLIEVGGIFLLSHKSTQTESDINNSILAFREAVQLVPIADESTVGILRIYGSTLYSRYNLTGNVEDVEEAISSLQKAVSIIPGGHADLPRMLSNLGVLHKILFERTGDFSKLSEAVSLHRQCLQPIYENHTLIPAWLHNLATSLSARFECTGDLSNILEAISAQQQCIQLTPEGHEDMPMWMNSLGNLLNAHFEYSGDVSTLSEAISLQTRAVQLTPEDDENLPSRLNDLGTSLQKRFKRVGDLSDISEAVSLLKECIQLGNEGHLDMPSWLGNLGIAFQARFEHTGDLADISEAILLQRRSVDLTPDGHVTMPIWLNNLGISLEKRFERTGDLSDMSEAISMYRKCVHLTPENHADLPKWLNNLGGLLETSFLRTGNLANISEAISLLRMCLRLTPEGHGDTCNRLNNLGFLLHTRFDRTEDPSDISEAISLQQKCIQLAPNDHADLPAWMNNLGQSFHSRYERSGDPSDVAEAILLVQESIHLTPEGHTDLPTRLNNLGTSLKSRFLRTGRIDDLSEAIALQRKSVEITPEGHASLHVLHNNLGEMLEIRSRHAGDANDARNAMINFRFSALSASGSPSVQCVAARRWARLARETDQSQLLEAHHTAVCLISRVAGLEQTIQNRYANLINISELSSLAVTAAIELGRYTLALEWFEQGRCLVWTQLNDLRTPINDLHAHDETLASEVVRVSMALQSAGSRAESTDYVEGTSTGVRMSIQEEAHTHIKLAREWDQLLTKVRSITKFADFLRPASCSTLIKSIPSSGHVVVINVHKDRSDALVLTYGAREPVHVTLSEFPYTRADALRRDLNTLLLKYKIKTRGNRRNIFHGSRRYMTSMADILRQLWEFVVGPILHALEYFLPASDLPRIWWCATGPLAFLPIHAAGLYTTDESASRIYTKLSDFAISSYIPTVRSLVEKNRRSREVDPENVGLLMISQSNTPEMPPIPGAALEVRAIAQLLTEHEVHHFCLESQYAQVERVKEQMDNYSSVHFACHAAQDTAMPLQSGFFLCNGRLELLEIIKKHIIGADLAYLSACQTSAGDEKLPEEAVHLAGGMLAAGYRGVVATMWSIDDSYGSKFAEEFYRSLLSQDAAMSAKDGSERKRLSSDGAAHALHYATQQIRNTLDNSEASLLAWVPYVYFGI